MFWRNKPLLITVILIIILFVLLFATTGTVEETGTKSVIGAVFSPLQKGLYNATDAVKQFFANLFSSKDIHLENAELTKQVTELENRLNDYNTIKSENERLKSLLNMRETLSDYDVISAQVIGKNQGNWFRRFTVNAGRDKGVETDMIVLTGDGLMGRVVSVADTYCKVISIIDTTSGVPAILERTRDYGVVKLKNGDTEYGAVMEMDYLPLDVEVLPGDTVLTSGLGGIYPKGLVVGIVSAVGESTETSKSVEITSAVDFRHIEEVMIIKKVFAEVDEDN